MSTTVSAAPATPVGSVDPIRWWLPRRVYKAILVVHVISAIALMGEVWGLVVTGIVATRSADPELSSAAYRLMESLVMAGGIPLSMIALISGITLGLASRWGIARHWWVFTKLGLLIGVIVIGMFGFSPEQLTVDTARPGAELPLSGQWWAIVWNSTQIGLLAVATVLSIFKPRGRLLPRRRKDQRR